MHMSRHEDQESEAALVLLATKSLPSHLTIAELCMLHILFVERQGFNVTECEPLDGNDVDLAYEANVSDERQEDVLSLIFQTLRVARPRLTERATLRADGIAIEGIVAVGEYAVKYDMFANDSDPRNIHMLMRLYTKSSWVAASFRAVQDALQGACERQLEMYVNAIAELSVRG